MSNIINYTGYIGYYYPTNISSNKLAIYCMSDELGSVLVVIPLVPHFSNSLISFIKDNSASDIYVLAPDMSILFVSDYYRVWYEISKSLTQKVRFVSRHIPRELEAPDAFFDSFIPLVDNRFTLTAPKSNLDTYSYEFEFMNTYTDPTAPYACDIIINDSKKKVALTCDMNVAKGLFYRDFAKDVNEIHMSYITNDYKGYSYDDLIRENPSLVTRMVVNRFLTDTEYQYVLSRGIRIGESFRPSLGR